MDVSGSTEVMSNEGWMGLAPCMHLSPPVSLHSQEPLCKQTDLPIVPKELFFLQGLLGCTQPFISQGSSLLSRRMVIGLSGFLAQALASPHLVPQAQPTPY